MKRIKTYLIKYIPPLFFDIKTLLPYLKGQQKEHLRMLNLSNTCLKSSLSNNIRVISDRIELLKLLPKNAKVAEIGVAEADFSFNILKYCNPEELILIDLWNLNEYNDEMYNRVKTKIGTWVKGERIRLIRDYSTKAITRFPDKHFDWVYLDASHDYDNVKKDLEAILPKVQEGGLICGHDYTSWSSGHTRFGVVEAVNQFCNTHSYELIYLTNEPSRHISYALKVKNV